MKEINAEMLNAITAENRDFAEQKALNRIEKIVDGITLYLAQIAKRGHYCADVWVNPIIKRHYYGVLELLRFRSFEVKECGRTWFVNWSIVDNCQEEEEE